MTTTLGIDPGLSGALALLFDDRLILFDTPTFEIQRNGKTRREIDVVAMLDIARSAAQNQGFVTLCVLEQAGARPKEGAASSWKNGCNWGVTQACVVAAGIPMQVVAPQVWKKAMGVTGDKDEARRIASRLLPRHAHNWTLKKHDGRAEAALMALYARQLIRGNGR